ncbi:hypothetical protein KAF25_006940 [Fusarium avenaceum]|uniref:MEI5 protein n=1 Tax=Fusarium avenaceum TaxID=40199 RepID=A0A9P7KQ87_9HYPO|nr:hypothetical protein KAF25_006940 [Fusarium avenaceum]
MPAQTEKPVQGAKDLSSQQDASASVRQLITLLHQYCSEGSFDALKGVVEEKEELKRDKAKLQIAYDENIQALSRRQAELQEQKASFEKQLSFQSAENEATVKSKQAADESIKKHQAKLTTMVEQIEKQSSSAKQLINEIKKKESLVNALEASKASKQESLSKAEKELAKFKSTQQSMQKRIDELTTSLNETRMNLTTFHSFVVTLDNFEARRSEVGDALDDILQNALSLMRSYIGIPLDSAFLTDTTVWGRLRKSTPIDRSLPLPNSNSPAARLMRVAAGLRIYSMALADHVFRATYLTQDNDFEDLLGDLETEDPLHEAFTRAVLLKIQLARPARTREARAKMVADQVSGVIADLVPPSQQESFQARLYRISLEACNSWLVVQQLLEPVRPLFSSSMPEDWVPLSFSTAQSKGEAGPPDAAREPSIMRAENQNLQTRSPTTESQPVETDDIMQYVWPAFFIPSSQQDDDVGDQIPELIHRGHVITRSQGREAEDEMSRRNARRNERQNSTSGPSQKKRRDSAILSRTLIAGASTEKAR